jgi:hypothetical protein
MMSVATVTQAEQIVCFLDHLMLAFQHRLLVKQSVDLVVRLQHALLQVVIRIRPVISLVISYRISNEKADGDRYHIPLSPTDRGTF